MFKILKRKNTILGLSILVLHAPMIGYSACNTLDQDICCEYKKGAKREIKSHLLNASCFNKWDEFSETNGNVWSLLEKEKLLCLTRRIRTNCRGIKKTERKFCRTKSDATRAKEWCESLGGKSVDKRKCRQLTMEGTPRIWLKNQPNNHLSCSTIPGAETLPFEDMPAAEAKKQ